MMMLISVRSRQVFPKWVSIYEGYMSLGSKFNRLLKSSKLLYFLVYFSQNSLLLCPYKIVSQSSGCPQMATRRGQHFCCSLLRTSSWTRVKMNPHFNPKSLKEINSALSSCRQTSWMSIYHLWNISKVRAFLSDWQKNECMLSSPQGLTSAMLSCLVFLKNKTVGRLQLVQKAAAQVLKKTGRWEIRYSYSLLNH